MKQRFILMLVLSVVCSFSFAQTTRYKFKVRFEDYTPLKNSLIIINNQLLNTDDVGIVDVPVPAQLGFAYVESSDVKKYQVKYPVESRAVLPKDPSVPIDVIIAKPSTASSLTRKDLVQFVGTIDANNELRDSSLLKNLEMQSRRIYDSVVALFAGKANDESKLANGRIEFFPLISGTLNQYLNEARDLNDAFATLSNNLDRREAYEQFIKAIFSYNDVFEFINTNKNTYEQAVEVYWNSKELSFKYSNIIDDAIENIHKPYILEMNYSFLQRLSDYNHETNRKKKKEDGAVLKQDMIRHSEELARRLNSLGERISAFNAILKNVGNINN